MFRKTKLSSAVAIALTAAVSATMLTGLTGCNLTDAGASLTSGSVNTITNPKGSVTGTVMDTNGNLLSGVSVAVAGKTTTTDVNGNYFFANVGVVNATGTDDSSSKQSLVVAITAPSGYLGATVTVEPEAQVDGTIADTVTQNGATLFIDGFIASAGTAVLPALTSTVTGTLRNNLTEQAIPNTVVTLDLETVGSQSGDNDQEADHDGVNARYQTFSYTATTGADGTFSIANVPSDSELRFAVEGHIANSLDYNTDGAIVVETDDEDVTTVVGNLLATPYVQEDDRAPYVTSVDGVQNQQASPRGQFNDDVNSVFVVNFSETMAQILDTNSVYVYDTTNRVEIPVTVAMAADGLSMTLTTATALAEGVEFDINMLKTDFQDEAGNIIDNVVASAPIDDVGFDSDLTTTNSAADVYRLQLRIFAEINNSANSVALVQMPEDTSGSDDDSALQASNDSFTDVEDNEDNGFQQLDSSDDDDSFGGSDAEERKTDLVVALGGTGVDADVARFTFTPDNASRYEITVSNSDGTANNAAVMTIDSIPDGDVVLNDLGGNTFEIADLNGSIVPIELLVDQVEPGTTVTITPFDDFNYSGAPDTLTLADTVTPTAVLQNSYGANPSQNGATTSVTFGDGGELSNVGASVIGLPVWNVTAGLLDNLVADADADGNPDNINQGDGAGNVQPSDNDLLFELMELNTVDNTVGGSGVQYITPNANGPYDATAFAAMNTARTGGFSMSENVTLTGTPTFSGTNAALSNYAENMDVTRNDDNGVVNVDLINADIDDVFLLAADTGALVDFGAGAVTDLAGNASVDATVVIRDDMPPMVESAVYDGRTVVVTFNEAVNIDLANDTINMGGVILGLTNSTMNGTNTVLTIVPEDDRAGQANGAWVDETVPANALDGFGNINRTTTFTLPQYPEVLTPAYVLQGSNLTEGHAAMNTAFVEDVLGNDWLGENAGVTYPSFAAIDVTGDFEVATAPTPPAVGATTISLVYVFEHPLDVATVFAGCGGTISETSGSFTLDAAAVTGCWTSTSGGETSTGANYNGANNTLTVNLSFTAVASGNIINFTANGGNAVGEYDAADTTAVANVVTP